MILASSEKSGLQTLDRGFIFGAAAMASIVVIANILVQYLVGDWLTWGAFVYPFAFLVTDLVNRTCGVSVARRVVALGFAVGVACSIAGSMINGPDGPIVPLRIAIASGVAFLAAQLLDVAVFDRLRSGRWWRAPLASTFVGSSLDTFLFFAIAFSQAMMFLSPSFDVSWAAESVALLGYGPIAPYWVSLALADFLVKLAIAMIALAPYRIITFWLAELRN